MPLEILKTIIYKHNYIVVTLLYKHSHLSAQQIQSRAKLSRKQVYTSIQKLKSVSAITKRHNKYELTEITKEILKYLNVIEQIEEKKLDYKVRDIIQADRKLSDQDKRNIIKALNKKQD